MSEKIAIIVCSNSGIDYISHPNKIDVFRSLLYVNGEEFEDYLDISADDFYERLVKEPQTVITTSQTAPGRMLEVYNRLESEGFTDAIVITVSSYLSGTYQNAVLAGNMLESLKVHLFDSRTVAFPEAKMALVASDMAKEGKSVNEILSALDYIRENNKIYFAVDTLEYLVKNGRLSATSGFMGSFLKIKPLLTITKEGRIVPIKKIRTFSKALNHVKEKFFEEVQDLQFEPFIIHTNNIELSNQIAKEIIERFPDIKEVASYPLTPVVGAHVGPGTLGIGYIKK